MPIRYEKRKLRYQKKWSFIYRSNPKESPQMVEIRKVTNRGPLEICQYTCLDTPKIAGSHLQNLHLLEIELDKK